MITSCIWDTYVHTADEMSAKALNDDVDPENISFGHVANFYLNTGAFNH